MWHQGHSRLRGTTYTKEGNNEMFGERRIIWKLNYVQTVDSAFEEYLAYKIFHRKRLSRQRCLSREVNDWMCIKCEGQFLRKIKLKAGKWVLQWKTKEECFLRDAEETEWIGTGELPILLTYFHSQVKPIKTCIREKTGQVHGWTVYLFQSHISIT